MKPHDESISRDRLYPALSPSAELGSQLTAACAGLAIVVFLWAFGGGLHPRNLHADYRSHATIAKLWDKHQDATRAVAALVPAPFRRSPNPPTRFAVRCSTTIRLAGPAAYRPIKERRPGTLSPHLSQIRLRAPPSVLA
jgi:hypothetical protein